MADSSPPTGPDLSLGTPLGDIGEGATLAGRVGDQPVLLSRRGGRLFAVGGACTHYGAMLAGGLVEGDTVRCPLHHACFSLKTGAALRAPALDGLPRWKVEMEGEAAFVRERRTESPQPSVTPPAAVNRIVIVGGGAAGLACATELRQLGHRGAIVMLSADSDAPYDRPNLSKDTLAGTAPAEWLPLRSPDWYSDNGIDLRLDTAVARIDPDTGHAQLESGERIAFDRLLIATGSEPNRLRAPGFDHGRVHTLRTIADALAIIADARPGARAAIVGSSFIGLEAAAALRARNVEVAVIAPEHVPFEHVFGAGLGGFVQRLHEGHGVSFHLGATAASFDGRSVVLADGACVAADFVLVGIGARPRTDLALAAGLQDVGGVWVDDYLETCRPGIFAAGDIAAYPDPLTGDRVRIEHWVTAERQGQTAAANMLGMKRHHDAIPFFWTEQYGVAIRYVGHGGTWDEVAIDGDLDGGSAVIRYFEQGVHRATATVGRDLQNLEDELEFERRIAREPGAEPAIQ